MGILCFDYCTYKTDILILISGNKKNLLLSVLLSSILCSVSGAVLTRNVKDTIPFAKPHKISQKKFIEKFRNNSKAVSIINYFFKRRNRSGWLPIVISLPIAAAAAILAVFASESLIIIFLLLLITGGIVLSTIGLVYLLIFSRKRLWRVLVKYSGDGLLSKNLKRKLRL